MDRVNYQAIFLDEESVEKLIEMQGEGALPKVVKNMHCTYKFQPSESEREKFEKTLLGKKCILKIVGYCSDGKNSGYEVELTPEQEVAYTNVHTVNENGMPKVKRTIPHVTVSMAQGAKAVDTGKLKFKKLERPFEVVGTAGFFMVGKNGNSYISFESQRKENDGKVNETQEHEVK